jgi:transposase-like protein
MVKVRWGRKSSQIPMAEKEEMVARWLRREPLDTIAPDYGVSPGMVSTIAIQEFGHPPHVKRKPKVAPVAEPVPEPVAEPVVALEPWVMPEPEEELMASTATLTPIADPVPALMAELVATRREVAELRREIAARLTAFELAVMRVAGKKHQRRDTGPQLSWPFGH